MKKEILEALIEMEGERYESIDEALSYYSAAELLDTWLRYKGISGYTGSIIRALEALGINMDQMYL